jgi:hypothetical protein
VTADKRDSKARRRARRGYVWTCARCPTPFEIPWQSGQRANLRVLVAAHFESAHAMTAEEASAAASIEVPRQGD